MTEEEQMRKKNTYEMINMVENQSQVLGSIMHSQTCSHFQTPELMPCWFMRSLSTAMSLSSPLRNLAVMGESGMKMLCWGGVHVSIFFSVTLSLSPIRIKKRKKEKNSYTHPITADHTTVRPPQNKNIIWYECSASVWMCPRP